MINTSARPSRRARRRFALAGAVVAGLALGLPAAQNYTMARLGPLDMAPAREGSTIAVDHDRQLLRAFTTKSGRWRLPVTVDDVDPRYLAMLRAFEDWRFDTHGGVDWLSLARAAKQRLGAGRTVSGGSTLTMQVARLLEPREERTIAAKLRQILRARELEARLDKNAILNLYLGMAPYGGNLEGVRAASLAYFGKEPKRLSFAEQALLVALPQSPETRRPDRAPHVARLARDRVLDRAFARGLLDAAELARAKAEPVPTARHSFPNLAPHAADAAHAADPDRRVLHFTYEKKLQIALEALVREHAEALGPKITGALIVIDNRSGRILARVGSADYFARERAGAIDMTQALRSPGSALKPFIYALAFDSGIAHPETRLDDQRTRFGIYAPENFDLAFQGQVTARVALQNSLNIPAVALLAEIGPARFLARLKGAGADIVMPPDAPPGLPIALGGLGARLHDVARLYAGLARFGAVPDLVERLDLPRPAPRDQRIAEPVAAWYVADILRGAPPPQNAIGGRIAFKTGTSYGYRDAWAIGYDSNLTIAVWFGRADNGAVPGLVARQVAAPALFDAFARSGRRIEPLARPRNALVASTQHLPPPLRSLRHDTPKTVATAAAPFRIAYPPNGARVDLGVSRGALADALLALKVNGGVAPFRWIINGVPFGEPDERRATSWKPDGAGFARISVMDARGASDSVVVRLE